MKKKFQVMVLFLFLQVCLFGRVAIDPVFTSNMVLQQECPIVFSGTADKGSVIKVCFADMQRSVKTDSGGRWRAVFPAMKASGKKYSVRISCGWGETLKLENVLVGDVWICAGQSNMEMPLGWKFTRGWSAQNCEEEVRNAGYPLIRYTDQANILSHNKPLPALHSLGGWVVCSPKTAGHFSAAGYFFARKLYKDLKIPVGLINLAAGGMRIEPWISCEGYRNGAGLEKEFETVRKFMMTPEQKKKFESDEVIRYRREISSYRSKMDALSVRQKKECAGYAAPGFDDRCWAKAAAMHDQRTIIRWYRTGFSIPAGKKGQPVILHSAKGPVARGFDAWINGHKIAGVPSSADDAGQVLNVRVPPEYLKTDGRNVLAVRACYFYGWDDRVRQENLFQQTELLIGKEKQRLESWKEKDELLFDWRKHGMTLPEDFPAAYLSYQFHCNLYNGMVDPWTKLPVKGVIWYHGCSNAGDPHYYLLHKALIADWRAKWHQKDLPFIVVQLAGYGDENWLKTQPWDAPYALTRDIQFQMLNLPSVGLVTAVDIGEPDNIHPADKQEVGRRLALEAERMVYGKKIVSRGPVFDYAVREGANIRVFFRNVPTGLKTKDGKGPGAFAVAGADRKFVWADARIDGKTVVVCSPSVPAPEFVRYAYADYRGDCNLCNSEGLPAFPFRSDAYDYTKVK